ncbi:MAG: hypothetical protein JSV56_00070 [Methanomassiliicoccales archaeon]|nr:MAG: hypothetical protein JSV56_00070 [Methanomassiliicoccales archaeon]
MKKIIYLVSLGAAVTVFLTCFGQPSSYESPSDFIPALISSNSQDIEFQKIGDTENQLIGVWYAENSETDSYSRLRFKADGSFQEDIYNKLTKEYLGSVRGIFIMENDQLSFTIMKAEQYLFTYQLTSNLLKLSPIVSNN